MRLRSFWPRAAVEWGRFPRRCRRRRAVVEVVVVVVVVVVTMVKVILVGVAE